MAPDDRHAWAEPSRQPFSRLIERYEEVAQLSRDMLAASRREDWEEVARLEARCQLQIEQLKRVSMIEALGPIEQHRRIELLRAILHDDAQIRERAEPWLLELERLIGHARRARSTD
jgi:flagellar protein FliT